ncbi:hypothetical protein DICPUDRAFT_80019 [Dictyostelium purpureum]|uniref:F-box domain-containing protein n=1 Tax=Dictyostelium purpureum TaxID=5786 RepID=F0ZPA7_DICPU|nr:uncharacterized protein DICPUDRAFT_80019 [Dictyostelium purpureum]EGC34241.1 hypothetical protein DICPUDRAFT_80019 [Dictyostelium purpureum]|eukprot:XP_003289251.1 hypothetical protein DICPUDRAFT_80019 [Dictyostelium purpureum]
MEFNLIIIKSFTKFFKTFGGISKKKNSMECIYGKNWEGLNMLPYEVLLNVFSFLDDLKDIKSLKLVSKTFNNIASECSLWRMFLIKLNTNGKITPRVCHSAIVYNNLMYVYGGHLPDSHTFIKDVKSDLNTFDFKSRKWDTIETSGEKLPEKTEHSAVVYKNSMYIFGGYSGVTGNYSDTTILKLNLDTLEGESINGTGQKPMGRSAHSAVVYDCYMYIFGGWDGTESNNTFYRLNLDTHIWEIVPAKGNPPPCIRSHSAVVHNNHLYIIGGYGPDGHTEFPYSYDLLNNEWIPMVDNKDGPCSRSRLRTVVYGDSLWCLGGWNRSNYYNDLWKFDLNTREWCKIKSSFDLSGIGQYSVVSYKNQLYFYGGYNPRTCSPQPNLYTYIVEKDLEKEENRSIIFEKEDLDFNISIKKDYNSYEKVFDINKSPNQKSYKDQNYSNIGIPTV